MPMNSWLLKMMMNSASPMGSRARIQADRRTSADRAVNSSRACSRSRMNAAMRSSTWSLRPPKRKASAMTADTRNNSRSWYWRDTWCRAASRSLPERTWLSARCRTSSSGCSTLPSAFWNAALTLLPMVIRRTSASRNVGN